MKATRYYNGQRIEHECVSLRYWIGGRGWVPFTDYLIWRPENPLRKIRMTETQFLAQTTTEVPA